ncbi:MAG: AbrB/MazE/SpoVT family DNA-binding domain-containing protein [Cetobacterium sp.]
MKIEIERKVVKIGNSVGVTIPTKLLEGLGFKIGDTLKIQIDTNKK